MKDLKVFRKTWSADLKRLRSNLSSGNPDQSTKDLFFSLHGVLHSGYLLGTDAWSYADHIFSDLTEKQYRMIPEDTEHSLIWVLWHISRIEDITMNILVKNGPQVYLSGGWVDKMNPPIHHAGNLILEADLKSISNEIEIDQLLMYRTAVGRQTQGIVQTLSAEDFSKKTQPDRLARIMEEGALLPEAEVLIEYWSRKKIYQLLLMPPTRHLMVHLNEALSLKELVIKSA